MKAKEPEMKLMFGLTAREMLKVAEEVDRVAYITELQWLYQDYEGDENYIPPDEVDWDSIVYDYYLEHPEDFDGDRQSAMDMAIKEYLEDNLNKE